jgi:tellurite resistance protein
MDKEQTRATLTVALMAAFADGLKDERERAAVKQVADALGGESGVDLPTLFRDVLLAKPELAQVVAPLQTPAARQFAYEMAVGVVNADGVQNAAEAEFLQRLETALQVPAARATEASAQAAMVASAASDAPQAPPAAGTVLGKPSLSQAEYDKLILSASVTNAALEILPESIASMAIIPLQLRLVYRIGQSYGYAMDMSHAKDFIATLGIGLTGQYLEQFGRRRRVRAWPSRRRMPSVAWRSVTTRAAGPSTRPRSRKRSPPCSRKRVASRRNIVNRSSRRPARSTRAAWPR